MFGLRKEVESLKNRIMELEEKDYQNRSISIESRRTTEFLKALDRIVKYSKENEPTYYFCNKFDASEVYLYVDKEEYPIAFNELQEYNIDEISVDRLVLKNNIVHLTITGTIKRHVDKSSKTYDFIVDYKKRKYILANVIEIKKVYNIDEVKIPGECKISFISKYYK